MILFSFFIEFNFDLNINDATMLVNKQDILYWLNIYNFLYFTFYKWIKLFWMNLSFYMIQFYMIIVYSNTYNKFVNMTWVNYFKWKAYIKKCYNVFMKRIIKPSRFYKVYYKFQYIGYLKIIFFILSIILLLLMLRRKTTYLKIRILMNIILFYALSISISCILVKLISNSFIVIMISLLISYVVVLLQLN
jgi:hypothetical protein